MDMPNSERWTSVAEIAEHLSVSKDTIYTWISAKKIPCHRVGHFWRFRLSEIDAWVRSGMAGESENGSDGESEK